MPHESGWTDSVEDLNSHEIALSWLYALGYINHRLDFISVNVHPAINRANCSPGRKSSKSQHYLLRGRIQLLWRIKSDPVDGRAVGHGALGVNAG